MNNSGICIEIYDQDKIVKKYTKLINIDKVMDVGMRLFSRRFAKDEHYKKKFPMRITFNYKENIYVYYFYVYKFIIDPYFKESIPIDTVVKYEEYISKNESSENIYCAKCNKNYWDYCTLCNL